MKIAIKILFYFDFVDTLLLQLFSKLAKPYLP